MAKKLPGVPIVVDENRYRGGLYIVEKFRPDIIILDDAFQHRKINRTVDIVLLNANTPHHKLKLFLCLSSHCRIFQLFLKISFLTYQPKVC